MFLSSFNQSLSGDIKKEVFLYKIITEEEVGVATEK